MGVLYSYARLLLSSLTLLLGCLTLSSYARHKTDQPFQDEGVHNLPTGSSDLPSWAEKKFCPLSGAFHIAVAFCGVL